MARLLDKGLESLGLMNQSSQWHRESPHPTPHPGVLGIVPKALMVLGKHETKLRPSKRVIGDSKCAGAAPLLNDTA